MKTNNKTVRVDYKSKFLKVEQELAKLRRVETEYQELQKAFDAICGAVVGVEKKTPKTDFFGQRNFRVGICDEDTSVFGKANKVISAYNDLKEQYGREDEGTALMQEHIDNLMLIIRTLTNDSTRESDRLEQEYKLKLMCPNCNNCAIDGNGNCRNCGYRKN